MRALFNETHNFFFKISKWTVHHEQESNTIYVCKHFRCYKLFKVNGSPSKSIMKSNNTRCISMHVVVYV